MKDCFVVFSFVFILRHPYSPWVLWHNNVRVFDELLTEWYFFHKRSVFISVTIQTMNERRWHFRHMQIIDIKEEWCKHVKCSERLKVSWMCERHKSQFVKVKYSYSITLNILVIPQDRVLEPGTEQQNMVRLIKDIIFCIFWSIPLPFPLGQVPVPWNSHSNMIITTQKSKKFVQWMKIL